MSYSLTMEYWLRNYGVRSIWRQIWIKHFNGYRGFYVEIKRFKSFSSTFWKRMHFIWFLECSKNHLTKIWWRIIWWRINRWRIFNFSTLIMFHDLRGEKNAHISEAASTRCDVDANTIVSHTINCRKIASCWRGPCGFEFCFFLKEGYFIVSYTWCHFGRVLGFELTFHWFQSYFGVDFKENGLRLLKVTLLHD